MLSSGARQSRSIGEIVNLMSVDTQRFQVGKFDYHYLHYEHLGYNGVHDVVLVFSSAGFARCFLFVATFGNICFCRNFCFGCSYSIEREDINEDAELSGKL